MSHELSMEVQLLSEEILQNNIQLLRVEINLGPLAFNTCTYMYHR